MQNFASTITPNEPSSANKNFCSTKKYCAWKNMLSAVKWKRKRSFFANECATKINLQKEFLLNCFFFHERGV